MKAAAGILSAAEIPFVLGGGLSAWSRGGPRSEHDVDFLLKPDDAETALEAFERQGWKVERPPEGWLYKTWHDARRKLRKHLDERGLALDDWLEDR